MIRLTEVGEHPKTDSKISLSLGPQLHKNLAKHKHSLLSASHMQMQYGQMPPQFPAAMIFPS